MKTLLIITEDVVKIQTLTGIFGKTFKFIYLNWLKIRLNLIITLLKPFYSLKIVCSDYFKLKTNQTLYYGQLLAKTDYSKYRHLNLKIVDTLLQNLDSSLFKTRLSIFLTYHYFVYAYLYQELINTHQPDIIITLSNSYHEQTVHFIAKLKKIKTIKLHFLTLIKLNHWLKHFFLNRQYQLRIKNFLSQSKIKPPSLSSLKSAAVLSLDFHRHLKTLAPLYQELVKQKKNPWIITDTTNLNYALKNLKLTQANTLYLASFLPKNYQSKPTPFNLSFQASKNLNEFLLNLSVKAALPIIRHSLTLQDLYLASTTNFFKLTKPKSVAVVSDIRYQELALSKLSKQTKINSVLVSPNTILDLAELNSYDTTNKVALVGPFIKEKLIKQGVSPKKLHLVGDLQSENYHQIQKNLNKKATYQKLGLPLHKKIILLISFRSTWMIPLSEKKAYFKMAAQAVKKINNAVLVIKPHPTEKRYRVIDELKAWGIKAIVSDNNQLELFELLNTCSVVLQTWSMTIFEAIMMSRPVISINPQKKDYHFLLPIIKHGGAVEVFNQKQLEHHLRTLINPSYLQTKKQLLKAQKACTRFIQTPDQKAAQRVADLLV